MDVNFQINVPTLIGSQYFKTRYRLLPAGAWSAVTNRTNAPFTITGLSAGNYELEAILVLEDETECAATFWPFTVVDPVECLDFFVQIIQASNGLYFLEITYSPGYNPPCGWKITHSNGTTTYATLPASPLLIPTQNVAQQVTIVSDGCEGNRRECYNNDVPAIAPSCTPITITSDTLVVNNQYPNGFYGMSLVIQFNQSVPASPFLNITVNQINVLNNGTPGQFVNPSYAVPTGSATGFSVPLVMNSNVFNNLYEVNWVVIDGCGQKHSGYASIIL